jgi:hypothetical protein
MQRLEVSGAVRPLKWPLGVKWLRWWYPGRWNGRDKKTHKSKGNVCKIKCITGKPEADYAMCRVQIQMVTLSLSTPWPHAIEPQIILNLDTRSRRVVRFRLCPCAFISGKRTTVALWRYRLVKEQTNILKNRITYRTAGRDVRTNEKCSSQVKSNCPSNVRVALSAS